MPTFDQIASLLLNGDGLGLFVALVFILPVGVRGVFDLIHSARAGKFTRSRVFQEDLNRVLQYLNQSESDVSARLGLEEAFRACYGCSIPAEEIKYLSVRRYPAKAISRFRMGRDFIRSTESQSGNGRFRWAKKPPKRYRCWPFRFRLAPRQYACWFVYAACAVSALLLLGAVGDHIGAFLAQPVVLFAVLSMSGMLLVAAVSSLKIFKCYHAAQLFLARHALQVRAYRQPSVVVDIAAEQGAAADGSLASLVSRS